MSGGGGEGGVVGGVSGAMQLDDAGRAVGRVSAGSGVNPYLAEMLPAWLLRHFGL